MSRVDSVRIAVEKARELGHDLAGSVLGSFVVSVMAFLRLRALEPGDLLHDRVFSWVSIGDLHIDAAFQVDALADWSVALGNFRTGLDAGVFIRAGHNLPADFSDPRLSETSYSHQYFTGGDELESRFSAYVLFGGRGRVVVHDASLDGPMFRHFDTGVEKEWLVGEVFAGFGLRWNQVELSYVHTFQTNNFEQQNGGQQFGSVALRVAF